MDVSEGWRVGILVLAMVPVARELVACLRAWQQARHLERLVRAAKPGTLITADASLGGFRLSVRGTQARQSRSRRPRRLPGAGPHGRETT